MLPGDHWHFTSGSSVSFPFNNVVAEKVGLDVMSRHVTNCPIPPIEATETEAPVHYLRREYAPDTGGPGRWRGGVGQVLEYKVLGRKPLFHHTSQKSVITPQGMLGGLPGAGGGWEVNRGTETERRLEYAIGTWSFSTRTTP